MAEIKTKGHAEKEFVTDTMKIKIVFYSKGKDRSLVLQKVHEQCENFLSDLKKDGFDISQILFHDDSISDHHYSDEKYIEVERKIIIKDKADLKTNSWILGIIRDKKYEVEYDVECHVSDINKKKKTLIAEAMQNSKDTATRIAEATGQKLEGIKEVVCDDEPLYITSFISCEHGDIKYNACDSRTPITDMISLPKEKLDMDVEVTWYIK